MRTSQQLKTGLLLALYKGLEGNIYTEVFLILRFMTQVSYFENPISAFAIEHEGCRSVRASMHLIEILDTHMFCMLISSSCVRSETQTQNTKESMKILDTTLKLK